VLHNTLSVNKAGINATLKSRCSLLAAANPEEGRFEDYYSVPKQINLEPPLISRFDLMFIVQDEPDQDKDEDIARHIIKTNRAGQQKAREEETNVETDPSVADTDAVSQSVDSDLFRRYVAHARNTCYPEMTDEAETAMVDFYVGLRKNGAEKDTISITARKLESLIRLAEASARVRLSDTVEPRDAKRAIEIAKYSLRQVSTDPETGELDADMVEAGSSSTQRKRKKELETIIDEICTERENQGKSPKAARGAILDRAEANDIDRRKAQKKLEQLSHMGDIQEPTTGYFSLV